MELWQMRLVAELYELVDRVDKLATWLDEDKYPITTRPVLEQQLEAMKVYRDCLTQRCKDADISVGKEA